MVIGSLITGAVGLVCVVFGYLIREKEKITLLHDYHYENVSPKDKKAFCRLSGLGILSVGIGLLLTAVILLITDSVWSFLAFAVGFVVGLALLITAGNRYNTKH